MESAEQIKNYLPGCVLRNRSRRRAAHQSRASRLPFVFSFGLEPTWNSLRESGAAQPRF
jgi:hypothetical protein